MNAPFCPTNRGQDNIPRGLPTRLPAIPVATDLPSLIRAVNIMQDILRSLTTSLTVNNFYSGTARLPPLQGSKSYLMSQYQADWYQVGRDESNGFVYHKTRTGPDKEQRVYVSRIDAVELRNVNIDSDTSFFWRYVRPLDGEEGDRGSFPFEEDFFERVVDVHWGAGEFTYNSAASPALFNIWSVSGLSTDGRNWTVGNSHINNPNAIGLNNALEWDSSVPATYLGANISGKIGGKKYIFAAGTIGVNRVDELGNPDIFAGPTAMYSADGGRSWFDAGLPLEFPTAGTDAFAYVVGYNAKLETFYVSALYTENPPPSGTIISQPFKSYAWNGSGCGHIGTTDAMGGTFTLPYPAGTKVCSVYEIANGRNFTFVSSCAPGQLLHMNVDGKDHVVSWSDYSVHVDGVDMKAPVDMVYSVAAGRGVIMAFGMSNNGDDEVHVYSTDLGRTWRNIPELQSLITGGLAGFIPFVSFS